VPTILLSLKSSKKNTSTAIAIPAAPSIRLSNEQYYQ
jgi:hypothetical protein